MRKLEAIIRKSKFKEVKKALIDGGFNSFNYHLTRCISEKSEKRFYRGVEYDSKADERVLLSIYFSEEQMKDIINIIKDSGKTDDAEDSMLVIFKASMTYELKGGDDKDKLIERIY